MNNKVVIIILTLNGKEYTINCLNSIKNNIKYKNYKVIVVDNNSNDGTQDEIKTNFKWVDLIENKTNRGFSGGNNDAINYSLKKYSPEYFYFLNNDTLVKPYFITEAVKAADKSVDVGMVGSKQFNFNNIEANSSAFFSSFSTKYYHGIEEKEVDWISGACFLVKRDVIDMIGTFDEIYNPAYYEETDWQKRASNYGYSIIYCPKSKVLHKGGVTSEKELKGKYYKIHYSNRYIFFMRYFSFIYFLPRIISDIIFEFKRKGIEGVFDLFSYYNIGRRKMKTDNYLKIKGDRLL